MTTETAPKLKTVGVIMTSRVVTIAMDDSLEVIRDIFKKVKTTDLMIFTRQFATLLDAKISLGDTLKNLHRQTRNPMLREAVFDMSSDIEAGLSLSQALKRHPTIFPEYYVNMVRSAEVTGRMGQVWFFWRIIWKRLMPP